jgi:hypothetical protein
MARSLVGAKAKKFLDPYGRRFNERRAGFGAEVAYCPFVADPLQGRHCGAAAAHLISYPYRGSARTRKNSPQYFPTVIRTNSFRSPKLLVDKLQSGR